MLSRQNSMAGAFVGLGVLLGYATASGKLSPASQARAGQELPTAKNEQPATTTGRQAGCCEGADKVHHVALATHNRNVAAEAQKSGKKTNICIIWGDDIGQSNISAYSHGVMGYKTPNIDRVAKEGMMFTDYYAEQSCTAGRASFITGQHGLRTGLTKVGLPAATLGLQKADPTIAEVLKPLGYATGQFGKNHLGDRNEFLPTVHGFDEFFGQAKKNQWTVVRMKNDWKTIFAERPAITAIDILLEPDAVMLRHAEANNGRLLKANPKGFALDATHRPHITLLQCFVHTSDLDRVYIAADKVFADAKLNRMKLEAFKYYYAPTGTDGVAGICAKPTPEIIKLQADVIAAVKPFTLKTGPISAFTAPHDNPAIDSAIIQYVSTFVPKMSGKNFNPHVSIGVASREYLDKMLAEPFETFAFSPAGAAVYQLGPFGTAAKKLKEWELKP